MSRIYIVEFNAAGLGRSPGRVSQLLRSLERKAG